MREDSATPSFGSGQAHSSRGGSWVLPGLLAVATGLVMTLLAKSVQVPGQGEAAPTRPGAVPELIVTRLERLPAGGEARERLSLMDPARLFLPAAAVSEPSSPAEGIVDRPGGGATEPFPPVILYPDAAPTRGLLRPHPPETPLAAMNAASGDRWFDGLPRVDHGDDPPAGPVAKVSGLMDVYVIGTNERIAGVLLPPDAGLGSAAWPPIELSVLVNAAGAVAAPVVTSGSGVSEVDERVRGLVSHELLPRLRLRPGSYRLVVGP